MQRTRFIHVKAIAVFHVKLTPTHHAEPRANFVTELPLDVIKRLWQLFIRVDRVAENIRNQLLVRWPIKHIAAMAIRDPQHFFAVIIVAPAFLPKFR